MTLEQRIKHLENQVSMLVRAAEQVLSKISDDDVAQRGNMGVWALLAAIYSATRFQNMARPGRREGQ
jgi:hypothetical protein